MKNSTSNTIADPMNDDRLASVEFDHFDAEVFTQMENLTRLADALVAIREGKLYGPGYVSFDDFVWRRFGLIPEFVAAIIASASRSHHNGLAPAGTDTRPQKSPTPATEEDFNEL